MRYNAVMIRIPGMLIVLRDWQLDDLEPHAAWLRPGQRWQELDAPYYPGPTPEEIPAIIARKRRRIEKGDLPIPRSSLAIADSRNNALLGTVDWYWESAETNWPCVGIVIYDPANWGQGRGYEALGLWSEHLFRELPRIARLDLRTWSGNPGMMRLATKLGYREEARFRKARLVKGQYYDGMGYGVLREEWEERYPRGFAAELMLIRGHESG